MTGFMNPLAPRSRNVDSNAASIKEWLRKQLALSDDVVISVNQVACHELSCSDVETVIGILRPGQPVYILRVLRPIADVTAGDLALAIQTAQIRHDL